MSTTKSLSTNMWPSGLITQVCFKSQSNALTQAKVCNPSQFIEQDPHIPSLHDLLNEKVESQWFLIYNKASKYIGFNSDN